MLCSGYIRVSSRYAHLTEGETEALSHQAACPWLSLLVALMLGDRRPGTLTPPTAPPFPELLFRPPALLSPKLNKGDFNLRSLGLGF